MPTSHAEQRAKLVEMITGSIRHCLRDRNQFGTAEEFTAYLLKILHGKYFINAVDVTEEMEIAAFGKVYGDGVRRRSFKLMATAGDLTNPEGK